MTLAEARSLAFERWKVALGGGDPRVEGGNPKGPTFREAADAVIAVHKPTWHGPKSLQVWTSSLESYVHPVSGDLPVDEVTSGHVMSVLLPIWSDKRQTARRVKQRISAICRWAVAQGHRTDDPAGIVIDAALPRGDVQVQHLPALPYDEVAECLATVKSNQGASASSKLALEFLTLTAARSGEVRKAVWEEMDIGGAVWTVPAERMKANREHRVPLSSRAVSVLEEAAGLSEGDELVFPGTRPGRPLSENTHSKLLRELGFATVTHGFRSSFRDWAAEQTNAPRAVMEAALAHTVRNKVEAAYARSDLFEKRRKLMEAWAKHLNIEGA